MFRILICIGLSFLYASQKTENTASASVSHQKGNIILGKSPTITTNPDYIKTKGGQNLATDTDADIDEVASQKIVNNYQIKDFQNWLKIDRKINLGLLLSRLTIILIIFSLILKAINRFTLRFVGSVIKRTHKHQEYTDVQSLANTSGPILNSILRWVLICITLLIVLTEIGVDIMPIISIFGVLGLAISIGAQTLVKDIISGILTLFEGIVSVGEIVEINGNIGNIEGMSLRAIDFRHNNGTIQVISFSEINSLINLSRDYSICNIVVPVSHEADIQKVEEAYTDVFNELKTNNEWKDEIIGDIEVTGILSITETAVYIRASMRVKPDPYDLFGQEFRKQLFMQMKERKIPAPKFANVMLEN